MILAVCVDNRMGLSFMGRRLSKDMLLREKLTALSDGRLRMSVYSGKQFGPDVYMAPDYLSGACEGDWVFAENGEYLGFADRIEQIVLFKWNRDYPADVYFSFPGDWALVSAEDFPGNSHETITMEVYRK